MGQYLKGYNMAQIQVIMADVSAHAPISNAYDFSLI